MGIKLHSTIVFAIISMIGFGCKTYKSNVMLEVKEFKSEQQVVDALSVAEENYKLRINDRFTLRVETNDGEALIDPNREMRMEITQGVNQQTQRENLSEEYTIQETGKVWLPMLGMVELLGKTKFQADSILSKLYESFYEKPFVKIRVTNRRAVVFNGGTALVVPMDNENMSILEVIALSGGLNNFTKAENIRLIRGDLNNPYVEVINLKTVEGMQRANLQARADDIIYIEPVRRVFNEFARDLTPVLTLTTSLLTLTILIISL